MARYLPLRWGPSRSQIPLPGPNRGERSFYKVFGSSVIVVVFIWVAFLLWGPLKPSFSHHNSSFTAAVSPAERHPQTYSSSFDSHFRDSGIQSSEKGDWTFSERFSAFLSLLSRPRDAPLSESRFSTCDPYAQPGYLNFSLPAAEPSKLNITSEHHIQTTDKKESMSPPSWVPFGNPECTPTDHMSNILNKRYEDWMYNSTVLVIGDSVDRSNLEYFCEHLGAHFEVYPPRHPLRPPPWDVTLDGKPDQSDLPIVFPPTEHIPQGQRNFGVHEAAFRSCTIKEIGFKMVSLFHFGIFANKTNEGRLKAAMAHFFPPAALELRIKHQLLPLLRNLKISAQDVDLVEFASSAWDTQEWERVENPPWSIWELRNHNQLNIKNFPSRFEPMSNQSSMAYADRFREVLQSLIDELFPSTRTAFDTRSVHSVGLTALVPAPKMVQLGNIQKWVLEKLVQERSSRGTDAGQKGWNSGKLEMNPWGRLMEGLVGIAYRDAVHPAKMPGGWLWGNIMLDRLRRWKETRSHLSSPL